VRKLGINPYDTTDLYQQATGEHGVLYRTIFWGFGDIVNGSDSWKFDSIGDWELDAHELRNWPNYCAVGVSEMGVCRGEAPKRPISGKRLHFQIELRTVVPWLLEEPMPNAFSESA